MGCNHSSTIDEKKSPNNVISSSKSYNSNSDIVIKTNGLINTGKSDQNFFQNYVIKEKIGSGTIGKVYKVFHIASEQHRALKIINKKAFSESAIKKFLKEIRILGEIDHPHIIKLYAFHEDEANFYLINELITGGELFDKITERKKFSEKDAANILKQILSAVNYLHLKGIIHRDLKPENILVNIYKDQFIIKLKDFGIGITSEDLKSLNKKIGAPHYLSPQVIKKKFTSKCDIWSCGVILYILLSGHPPFTGNKTPNVLENILIGKFNFDANIWRCISSNAKKFINKLLSYNEDNRLTAGEAIKDPWLTTNVTTYDLSDEINKSFKNLINVQANHKLQHATIAYLVHQISNHSMTQNLRKIFEELDSSGDGRLSYEELKNGFKLFYKDGVLAEKAFTECIKRLDSDKNNFIEYEEFLRATIDLDLLLTDKNLKMAFDFFDSDGSGRLGHEEISKAIGVNANDSNKKYEMVQKVLKDVNVSGDGMISFHEFKVLMKKL